MCGITGCVGAESAVEYLLAGLSNLEYRGYDSAGLAVVDDDGLTVRKRAGGVDRLEEVTEGRRPDGGLGIGHTRWSTHGPPTDANAHPHTDCFGRVAVVHNGIIENHDELRERLVRRGHEFTSETDTEVVPHLVEDRLASGEPPGTAFRRAVAQLRGSYAIVALVRGTEALFATREGSPLVVGVGEGAFYLASDVPAFLEYTDDVVYLDDGDHLRVTPEGYRVTDAAGECVDREVRTVEWTPEDAEKDGFDHYMLKEIHEQPQALRQTISGRLDVVNGEVDLDLDLPEQYLQSVEEIQIVACGTSYHAGLYARRLLEDHADVRASVEVASEYEFTGGRDPWRTLVVAVTQSGETADTLRAMRSASAAGARTLALTNTVGSTAAREADDIVYIRAGPEIGVAATKTFAAQVTTLALLTVEVGRTRGALTGDRASTLLENVRGLPGAIQQVLDTDDDVREVAREYANSDAFFFIGRKLGMPVSLEGALKLKEISYRHAEGFAGGELKHGTLALVTEDTPVLAVLTDGANATETLRNVKEVESRGAPVVGAASLDDAESFLDASFSVPDLGVLEPLVANVYLQLFAYHVADNLGRNIDKPRNLAKSVTVE